MKIMFDGNIFDRLIEAPEVVETIKSKHEIFITIVQIKELNNITDKVKKERVMELLDELSHKQIPIPISFSNLDFAHFSFGCGEYKEFIIGNSKQMYNDALLSDAAIEADCILVSNDKRVLKKVRKL